MSKYWYNIFTWLQDLNQGSSDTWNQWYYPLVINLTTSIPVWQEWWYALVWETDTFWVWDWDTASWIDSWVAASPAYINSWVNNVAVGWLGANQWPFNTSVQAMLDRFLYPFIQQSNVLTIAGTSVFEKGVEQAPRLLTNNTTRSLNPTYPITSTVFKREWTTIDTQAWDNTPVTYNETASILDTVTFSAEVTNNNGYTSTNSKTLTALHPYFWGKATGARPTRDQALIDSGNKVVASSTGTIIVDFNSSTDDWLWFAIPATSTSKTKWYVNALNNGNIGSGSDLFDAEQLVTVDSPDLYWNGIPYKIYVSTYKSEVSEPMELRNS